MARRSEFKVLNLRVKPEVKRMLERTAKRRGVTQTAAIEAILRQVTLEDDSRDTTRTFERTEMLSSDIEDPSNRPKMPIDEWIAAVKALGPIGPSIRDEDLTSEALYADHP